MVGWVGGCAYILRYLPKFWHRSCVSYFRGELCACCAFDGRLLWCRVSAFSPIDADAFVDNPRALFACGESKAESLVVYPEFWWYFTRYFAAGVNRVSAIIDKTIEISSL